MGKAPPLDRYLSRVNRIHATLLVMAGFLAGTRSNAGSGPHRVAVVVNDNCRKSQEIGHYYCTQREIPEANLIHVESTTNDTISLSEFRAQIFTPITNYLAQAGLLGQVDTIVYTQGIPYRVSEGTSLNGITSVTYYGFKTYPDPALQLCSLPDPT